MEVLVTNQMYLHQVALALAAERRQNPGDDLFSALVHAEIEGARLTDLMKALTDNPDQRAWLLAGFDERIGTAVDEFIRWATPVMTFRRTAATDCELGGAQISAGEKVVMFYSSANWDSAVFTDPHRLDLGRHPHPHVGFGGADDISASARTSPERSCEPSSGSCCARSRISRSANRPIWQTTFVHAVRALPCNF
ncbi:hypothetical protein MPRF_01040 [Mycolicibacterium parafortuitum]|uniref:Cytochrome P450 n=1 Tax=Mycolicibacterium parafortuitum TaxID=39692 RepID=A0A7I7TXB8_MYCPF|nr:hypothetical protein MPRF_01040 [Mycolicibacterium parafortuitum]